MTNTFFIEQFVEPRLGNSAYLAGSHASHRAVLIDPLRDVDQYRQAAERLGVQIAHVLDTHLHNDFVSGARELAAQTGATIGVSAADPVGFEHQALRENDALDFEDWRIRVLATPGHTPEHISFLLERDGQPHALFSGGALMVGGAARTDLLGHEHAVPLARESYRSIHHKLLTLDDEVAVYPTHGAGTFCAAPVSSERSSTIGRERRGNYLALADSEEDFVKRALSDLPSYPVYYPHVRAMNRRGPRVLGGVPALKPLSPEEVQALTETGAAAPTALAREDRFGGSPAALRVAVLDVRPARRFAEGHIPGAYGIAVDAPLSTWAGWLIPFGTPLVLVADSITDRVEAVRQLIRIGYDDLRGALHEGMEAWAKAGLPIETVSAISARELRERLRDGPPLTVLDVRMQSEWEAGHIPGALHIENGRLATQAPALPAHQTLAVHCAHGARSMAGVSVLLRKGYRDVIHVNDGITGWQKAGGKVVRGA